MSEEIATRSPAQELAARVRGTEFKDQVALALPENVRPERFVRATITALLQNPDLAEAVHNSIFSSLLRAAQDGLVPDGKEAALVVFNTKVDNQWVKKAQYMPMISGFRKIAAEHGWVIRSAVVYENDVFEYELGLETKLIHRPARPGIERGEMVAAYAVAVNRDGQREFEVMYEQDIEKVRGVSRSKDRGPWVDWPDRMWEKTVARRLFAKLPLDRSDARIARLLASSDDTTPSDAAERLYGPGGATFEAREISAAPTGSDEPPPTSSQGDGAGTGGDTQQAEPAPPHAGSAPGADDDPEPQPPWAAAGTTEIPAGQWKGKTLAEVGDTESGREWLGWALKNQGRFNEAFHTALTAYVEGALPELWQQHTERQAAA